MAQFILLLHHQPANTANLSRDRMMEVIRRYASWSDGLRQKGKMVGGEKLTASGGRHVRIMDGQPVASDGPYAEAKDVIGGYFVIEATDDAEAEAIAKDCPHLWSPTNWVELRPFDSMAVTQAKAAG